MKKEKNMTLSEKLKEYFEKNGIQMKWFAEKLGINKGQFYNVVCGVAPLPKKHWLKVVQLTNGKITLMDILQDSFKGLDVLEFKSIGHPESCIVSLKDFNNKF